MKIIKKFLIILTSLVLLAPIAYFCIYIIQNITLTKSYVTYNEGQGADSFIRCNLNIFEPEFASAFFAMEKGHISFKKTKMFLQTDKEWETSYTGGTTIKNTTFPELVKMVKEDCSQFQYGYDNPDPDGPRWTYTAATEEDFVEYQEPTETEIRVRDAIHSFKFLTEAQQAKVVEHYGPMGRLNVEELIEWDTQIRRDLESGAFSLD